ncbi:MAG: preprotein translocase subunit YajC [Thermoanaerobaculia bacterium]
MQSMLGAWMQLAQAQAQSPLVSLVPIFLVFGIFYFLLLAPMRKRQKALAKVVADLKRGDRVVTNGGLIGEIAAVEDRIVHLKLADNVKVRVLRSAVAGIEGAAEVEVVK